MQNAMKLRSIGPFSHGFSLLLFVLTVCTAWLPTTVIQGANCDCCQNVCDCGSSCGYGQDCGRYYYGARVGGMIQDRSTFRLGKITEDSNDVDPGFQQTYAEPGFDAGGDGPSVELFVGSRINDCWSAEGRFGYASLKDTGNYAVADLSNFSFQAGNGGFWVPFIDASALEHGRGVFGMRLRNDINVDFEYDSDWFDFGIDFVRNVTDSGCHTCNVVVGPAFANINQRFRHITTGDWNGPVQTSDVAENLDEWFLGALFGLRDELFVTSRLSLISGVSAYAYYHHAEFDGYQFLDTAGALGSTYNTAVADDTDNFSARLGINAGLSYEVNCSLRVGFLYRLESWHNVASVANPDLTLLYADSDNRWTGDTAAHLVDDQAVTQNFLATVEWRR